jgi:hypothetical protein
LLPSTTNCAKGYATEMDGASSISVLRERLPNLPELDAYNAKVLNQNDKVKMTLRVVTPAPSGWLDRPVGTRVQPTTLTLDVPDIPEDRAANSCGRGRRSLVLDSRHFSRPQMISRSKLNLGNIQCRNVSK